MTITILNSLLGTPRHLVHDGVRFTWTTTVPEDTWVYPENGSHRSLQEIASALGKEISGFEDTPHGNAWEYMTMGRDIKIPWIHALPTDRFQRYLSDTLDQLWMIINEENDSYYMNEFVINRELLKGLDRPSVDDAVIDKFLLDSTDKSRGDLLKFSPDGQGCAPRSVYTQNNTVTGRLTITHGPNILTLKKKYRRILKSSFKNGAIIQADIVSLEPRIALCVAQKTPPTDIYATIRDDVLNGEVSRSQAKIATLGCIYGMSPWTLSQKLPENLNARDILMKIRSYFDIPHLERELKREFLESGHIKNVYGRRINTDSSLVNHFLQSTGADASLLAFDRLKKCLCDSDVNFKFLYVIHDAILLDVDDRAHSRIKEITSEGLTVPKFKEKFPIKLEPINGDKDEQY